MPPVAAIGAAVLGGVGVGVAATSVAAYAVGGAVVGAVLGGAVSAIKGDNVLEGALKGGVIGGLAGAVGGVGAQVFGAAGATGASTTGASTASGMAASAEGALALESTIASQLGLEAVATEVVTSAGGGAISSALATEAAAPAAGGLFSGQMAKYAAITTGGQMLAGVAEGAASSQASDTEAEQREADRQALLDKSKVTVGRYSNIRPQLAQTPEQWQRQFDMPDYRNDFSTAQVAPTNPAMPFTSITPANEVTA